MLGINKSQWSQNGAGAGAGGVVMAQVWQHGEPPLTNREIRNRGGGASCDSRSFSTTIHTAGPPDPSRWPESLPAESASAAAAESAESGSAAAAESPAACLSPRAMGAVGAIGAIGGIGAALVGGVFQARSRSHWSLLEPFSPEN